MDPADGLFDLQEAIDNISDMALDEMPKAEIDLEDWGHVLTLCVWLMRRVDAREQRLEEPR